MADPNPDPNASPWSSLPEDLRSNPAVVRHKDVGSLVKEYVGAQSLLGRKGVIPPANWDDEADVGRFYKEIGVPEKHTDYDLSKLEVGENWDKDLASGMLERMHKAGLTPRQVEAVMGGYNEITEGFLEGVTKRAQEAHAEADAALRKEFGSAYDERIRRASEIFHAAFGEKSEELRTLQLQDGSLLGDHPAFLRGLAKLGDLLGEDNLISPERRQQRLTQTPEEAAKKFETLMADPEFVADLTQKDRPGHALAVQTRADLYAAMAAGK